MTPNVLVPLQGRNIEQETKWMKYLGIAHAKKPNSIGWMTKRCDWNACHHTQSAKRKVFDMLLGGL